MVGCLSFGGSLMANPPAYSSMRVVVPKERPESIDAIDWGLVFCLSMLGASIFAICNAGRIDIIDGQWRFEVAYNLVKYGSPEVVDPAIRAWAIPGRNGAMYSGYGISSSLLALPFVGLAEWFHPGYRDLAQFSFSFVSPLFGGVLLGALYLAYRWLCVKRIQALFWVLVFGFASLVFPLSTSAFDQIQHALFLLITVGCAYQAGISGSVLLAGAGIGSFAILAGYQIAYFIVWPSLLWLVGLRKLSDFPGKTREPGPVRTYWLGGWLTFMLIIAFNVYRFGVPWIPAGQGGHPPVFGNLISGFLLLLISPGKGILWYSPPVLFCLAGWSRFRRKYLEFSWGVLLVASSWLLLIATLSFPGGDWSWGPRYWVPVLPLLFLAAPFVRCATPLSKFIALCVLLSSLTVQILSISVDHQRFFFERNLQPFFWYKNAEFYYHDSALASRVVELESIQSRQNLATYRAFRPGPYPEMYTYAFFGPKQNDRLDISGWLDGYAVFWLPRPWPLWSLSIDDESIQMGRTNIVTKLIFLGAIGLSGIVMLLFRARRTTNPYSS